MDSPTHGNRRCKAKSSRTGQPCRKYAINGADVCPTHGGRAPQVIEAARRRLLAALDPAAANLVEIARGTKRVATATKEGVVSLPPRAGEQVRAIEAIMDRAGLPARKEVTGEDGAPLPSVLVINLNPKKEETA